jgi:hypothetical protein
MKRFTAERAEEELLWNLSNKTSSFSALGALGVLCGEIIPEDWM